jgi:RNA recognition motif-containing protein
MKIYVGNLSPETAEPELQKAFEKYGQVSKVTVATDKVNGKPRGFGFVEMASNEHAQAAIVGLHGMDLGGLALNVNEARPRTDK